MNERAEHKAIISGAAQSQVGRRLMRGELDLTLEACLRAIEDAGLSRDDIDGLASYPGKMGSPAGFSGPGTPTVQDSLRLQLNWHRAGPEGAAQYSPIIDAVAAVAAGYARHVLVYRTVTEASAQKGGRSGIGLDGGGSGVPRMDGELGQMLPFGAFSASNWVAWHCQRYMHEHKMSREQLAQISLNARRNAALNDSAIYRDELSLDDYLGARMISTPLCLLDCDVPADGATAFIISAADYAPDMKQPVLRFEAIGSALHGRPSWFQRSDLTTMAASDAAQQLWSRTSLRPADVDVAQLYDGFSWLTVMWLEALGFCEKGGAGAFIESGENIARDGKLPLNTGGGQLSGGRLHGFGLLYEAVVQLRGTAGKRQVAGDPRTAIAAAGGGPLAGVVLLARQ
ncbi:MAG: acetyl-CoA acetyltransferase [Bermanella sp.]|jgi:acetyl-CoA acetyltransferase